MQLEFTDISKNQITEFNTWQAKENAGGQRGLDEFVVSKGSLLGEYLEFISKEMGDITVQSVLIDNALAGFIGYSQQGEDHIHVEILGINPDFRGKGIANKLLQTFKARMQEERNITRLTLSVRKDNEAGKRSFAKVGNVSESQDKENYINFEL